MSRIDSNAQTREKELAAIYAAGDAELKRMELEDSAGKWCAAAVTSRVFNASVLAFDPKRHPNRICVTLGRWKKVAFAW